MEGWRRNLYALCAAQLLNLIGFSSYLSFIPYYIQEFTGQPDAEVLGWTASMQTAGALAMMIAAPIWGGLADRYGRKLMLIRATAAAMVIVGLMALVRDPGQLLVLRVLQGVFCGTVAAAMTLVATGTPERSLGTSLGLMQMTQFLANAVGPFLGGMAADALGYRAVFPGASALMAIALAIVVFLVREDRSAMARPRVASARRGPRFSLGGLQAMAGANSLVLIGCLAGAAFAGSVVSPVLPLYLKALAPGTERIATLSGAMVSITAVTAAIASVGIGKLGDRYGQKLVLVSSTLGVAALAVPQAFVRTATELLVWRGVHGTFVGGIMPTANALLARTTRPERRGSVFGLASGAQAGGMALGPALGAAVASQWGMGSAFLVTAGVFVLISLLVVGYVRTDTEMPGATPVEGVEVEYPGAVAEPATAPEAEA